MADQNKDLQENQLERELEIPPNKKLDLIFIAALGLHLVCVFGVLRYYGVGAANFFIYQIAMTPVVTVLGLAVTRIFIKKPAVTFTPTGLLFNRHYGALPPLRWSTLDRVEIRRILFADYYLFFIKDAAHKYGVVARLNKMLYGVPYLVAVSRLKISPEGFKENIESYKATAVAG